MEDFEGLVRAVVAGDGPARDRLAAASLPFAVNWAARLVDDQATAEDVAQEALVEALGSVASLRHPAAFGTWVRLAVRKHSDRHRRRLRPHVSLDAIGPELVEATGEGPAEVVERQHDVDVVRRALAVACDGDRLLVELRYRGEWSDTALAELLGITPGAVRKRLHDARRRIKSLRPSPTSSPVQLHLPVPAERRPS